jgi:hypothetical protein
MGTKTRLLSLTLLLLAFGAGFLLAISLRSPQLERDSRAYLLPRVGPENGIITINRFPPHWPRTFPLPGDSPPKWAVATEANLWACFTGSGGLQPPKLLRHFRIQLQAAGYQPGPTIQTKEGEGDFVGKLGFARFRKGVLDEMGRVTVPLTPGSLELGGIVCGFSVELQFPPE